MSGFSGNGTGVTSVSMVTSDSCGPIGSGSVGQMPFKKPQPTRNGFSSKKVGLDVGWQWLRRRNRPSRTS